MKKMTALELMLCVKNERIQIYYHRDTKVFDLMPVSQFELEHSDWDIAGIRTIWVIHKRMRRCLYTNISRVDSSKRIEILRLETQKNRLACNPTWLFSFSFLREWDDDFSKTCRESYRSYSGRQLWWLLRTNGQHFRRLFLWLCLSRSFFYGRDATMVREPKSRKIQLRFRRSNTQIISETQW